MLSVKVYLAVLFGEFDLAWSTRQKMGAKTEVEDATYYASFVTLPFKGLIEFAMYRSTKQKKFLKDARRTVRSVQEVVESVGAVNYHHMLLFLKAEEAAATLEIPEYVRKAFDEVIRSAKRSGFLQHGALMNERCGLVRFLNSLKKQIHQLTY
jgi:hypothetical protein